MCEYLEMRNSLKHSVLRLWSNAGSLLLLCNLSLAQAVPAAPANSTPPTAVVDHATAAEAIPGSKLVIGPGDLIEVSVFGAGDFDKQVRVSDDGDIMLPFIAPVVVSGLNTGQAEQIIAKRLSDGGYFNNPRVSVFVKDYATGGISVLGEVQKPGIYQMLGSRTLLDAISMAGGTGPKAGKTVTITHRDRPDSPETVTLPNSPGDPTAKNTRLRLGDIVVVSKAGIVYVVGAVRLPTGILLENPSLTVLQAIAMAQGTEPTASLNHARLIRNSSSTPSEISLPLKKILEGKSPDLKLQADDIVFVPSSAAKAARNRGIEAILQTVTGVAMYGKF